MKGSKTFIFFTILSLLCSCGQSKDSVVEVHSGSRDKVTAVTLTSIDDALPIIHSDARFQLCGDTLIINDHKSSNLQFVAYDLINERYLGSFGKVGQGPGEVANFGGLFYDPKRGILYGLDLGKWQITGFNLREAVVDSTYDAFTKVKLTSRLGGPFNCPHYVNDSTVYCSVKVPYENGMKLTSHVGKFNMLTGERVPLDSIAEEGNSALITVSLAKKMIIETDVRHDRIRFYDLDGNLKKIVYGPDYSEKDDRRTRYFSEPKIAGDKILALYSGRNLREGIGHEIIVMDLDGNYIRTLDAGVWISSIVYHDKTDRVYISSDDEPQFGYFNLSEALGEPAAARKVSAPIEDKVLAEEAETESLEDSEPAKDSESGEGIVLPNGVRVIYSSPMAANAPAYSKSRKNEGPLALADGSSHIMEPVDIVTIGADPDEATGGKYYVVCLYDPESEDVTVESIILPDARFEVEWTGRKNYMPGLLSTFILKAKKAVRQDDYRFILTYKGDRYAPQTFHINLHPE